MKKFKSFKALCTVLVSAMLLQGFLAGCGSTKDTAEGTAKDSESTVTATQTTAENPTKDFVTISWYMRKSIDNMKNQEKVEEAANKIIKEKINANLKLNLIDTASWEDKMKLMSAAGEAYDIVFTSLASNSLTANVSRGALMPLDELLDKYGSNIKKKVDKRAWQAATFGGKIFAIPSQSPWSTPTAFVFKKDLVDKYKFDYKSVKTLADLEPYLETIKKNEPNMVPLLAIGKMQPPGASYLGMVGFGSGINFDEKTGKIALGLEVPEYQANLRKINEYYKKGYIAKDAASKTDGMAEAKSGKYAVLNSNGGYTEDGSKSTGMYGYPCYEALYGYPMISTNSMILACSSISKTSENPDRAMMLLDLVWGDKTLSNTLAYGVEGQDYTVTAGKGTDTPTVLANSGAQQTWAIWHNVLGPLWDQWDSNWNSTAALEQMKHNNDNAKTSSTLGFVFDNSSLKSEVAQLAAVSAEIDPVLNTGIAPDFDKYLAEAIQKQKDAGIEKVKAEWQKQYDEWKAKNK